MSQLATPPSEDSKELFKLLADREWHLYSDVKDAIAAKVPPGRALRKYNDDIDARRRMKGDPQYDTTHNDDARIKYGALRCAQAVITAWRGKGVMIEVRGTDKWIKVKPGFVSASFPGYEPTSEALEHDPPPEDEGSTEVPPADSVAPEERWRDAEVDLPPKWTPLADYLKTTKKRDAPVWTSESPKEPAEAEPTPAEASAEVAAEPDPAVAKADDFLLQVREKVDQILGPPTAGSYAESEYSWAVSLPQGCPECGLEVLNPQVHQDWHESFVKRSEQVGGPLSDTSQLKHVVRDVMGQVLDEFQAGMQNYLELQFSHVNATLVQLLTVRRTATSLDPWLPPRARDR